MCKVKLSELIDWNDKSNEVNPEIIDRKIIHTLPIFSK